MALARSRITAQGQISVPANVRRKLGVGPGSLVEWEEEGDHVVVRPAGKYTFEDLHQAVFAGKRIKSKSVEEMKEGIRKHIRDRHASR